MPGFLTMNLFFLYHHFYDILTKIFYIRWKRIKETKFWSYIIFDKLNIVFAFGVLQYGLIKLLFIGLFLSFK